MVNSRVPVISSSHVKLDQLPDLAEALLAAAGDQRIWLFLGEMGAGKTTLIKALAEKLDVSDTVASPTYSIVNEYRTSEGGSVYHFDFYRIEDDHEAEDIGVYDYFDSGSYCLIEWPEKIERLLPGRCVIIRLEADSPETRRIEMHIYE